LARTLLGFDSALDATADMTRRQVRDRLFAGVAVLLLSISAIPASQLMVWLGLCAVGETLLWVATDRKLRRLKPTLARVLRLASSAVASTGWAAIASMWWLTDVPHGSGVAVAMICGVMLYIVRGCHRSIVHMVSVAAPLAVALVVLPFFEPTLSGKIQALGALLLVMIFTTSSAINSWKGERRLAEATEGLLLKQREAAAANEAKSAFLANISHEIRTPLNGIVAMAHMLRNADLPPNEREAAALIAASGETLETLLSDILDTAKIDAGRLSLEETAFHAGDLVRSVSGLLRLKAEEKGISLLVEIAPELDRHYLGDPTRVRQILTNLLSNAVKFTDLGEVAILAERSPTGGQRFTVRDTGIGFDPSKRETLFQRFQQADGTITRKFGGTGLGLSISQQLAQMMGGVLACDSVPGQGSAFWLDIDLPAADPPAASNMATDDRPGLTRTLSVLVADDHPTNRRVAEMILNAAGVRTTVAEDGAQAVEAVRTQAFDLVLMDMQMPVMDGLAATRIIRSDERVRGATRLPILLLTANAQPEHIASGQAAGADGHLTKPIKPDDLLAAIASAIATSTDDSEASENQGAALAVVAI
jgi:signal transduction histidine kinase/AmiR/NasT family two-component response regulator